jgi:hypothetical protein
MTQVEDREYGNGAYKLKSEQFCHVLLGYLVIYIIIRR